MSLETLIPRIIPAGKTVAAAEFQTGKMHTLLSGRETGGAFTLLIDTALPVDGPPLHVHHNEEDEALYVLEGTLTLQLNGERFTLLAGGSAFLPRDIPHTYANLGTETARTLCLVPPAGLEKFFAEVEPLVSRAKPDIAVVMALAARYNIELPGLPLAAVE